jgi:hypothetical protein
MSYLARLKAEISGKRPPSEPTEPTKGASVGFVSTEGSRFSEIVPAAADIERAAIIEHEAGYPAAVADRHAREGWRAEDWHAWLSETAARRHRAGDDDAEARRFAYGAAISEWHARHGARQPPRRCPGCDKPIDGRAGVLALPDGVPVHGAPCLVSYGARWKLAALEGLASLGILAPDGRTP